MDKPIRVLLLDDNEADALLIIRELKRSGFEPTSSRVDTRKAFETNLDLEQWDVVLADYSMPSFTGLEALQVVRERDPDLPFIIVSSAISDEMVVQAMHSGAHDYIVKDNLSRLGPAVERELREADNRRQRQYAKLALRRSEEKFRSLIDTMNDGLVRGDQDFNIIFANRKFCDIIGRTEGEVVGRNISEFVSKEHQAIFSSQKVERKEGTSNQYELDFVTKDGKVVNAIVSPGAIFDKDGIFTGSTAVVTDITDRKHAEEALKESERKLALRNRISNVFLTVPDDEMYAGVLEVILESMESNVGAFGYIDEKGSLIVPSMTRGVWDQCQVPDKVIVFPQDQWGGIWGKALTEGKTFCNNKPYKVPEGHIPIDRSIALPIIHQSKVIGLIHVANKETDYQEEDIKLLENIAEYIAPVLHARLAKDRAENTLKERMHDLGERVKELRGLFSISELAADPEVSLAEMLQGTVNIIPPAWHYPEITCARIILEDKEFRTENFKETEWMQSSDITVDGEVISAVQVYYLEEKPEIDEGPFQKEERDLIEAVANQLSLYVQRNRMEAEQEKLITQLEAQNAELERFTYTVSHDLKSPLITIRGFLGMLEKDIAEGDKEQLSSDIKRIGNAAEKMMQLLDDLLALSRIGRLVNPPIEIPLENLIYEVLENVAGPIHERDVKVVVNPYLPIVYGDRPRLIEVLQNLIENAVKFMEDQPNPLIEIGANDEGEKIVCFVRDNGIGIDPKYHEKVFDIFDQLNKNIEGVGIGLALVKRIVEVHGGRIWVESVGLGHGSTFYFTIPNKRMVPDLEGAKDERRTVRSIAD